MPRLPGSVSDSSFNFAENTTRPMPFNQKTSEIREQLLLLREITRTTGILHEAQILQLKYWPWIVAPNAKSIETQISVEDKKVHYHITVEKIPKHIIMVKRKISKIGKSDYKIKGYCNNKKGRPFVLYNNKGFKSNCNRMDKAIKFLLGNEWSTIIWKDKSKKMFSSKPNKELVQYTLSKKAPWAVNTYTRINNNGQQNPNSAPTSQPNV